MILPRLSATPAGPAGLLAAIIASVGRSGVMADAVSRRTQEAGIRVAVGAGPRDVLWLVMRQSLAVSGIGLVVGLAAALASSKLLAALLFGVTPTDPAVFVGVPALMAAVAELSCYMPARRTLKVDPLIAL
jgi:putative ABC transport system permease protein